MAKKRTKLDKATDIVAKIIKEQLDTLPDDVAEAKRKELHDLAVKVSLSSGRGKRSQHARNAGLRRISRSHANIA
jgi:hypothetical protein